MRASVRALMVWVLIAFAETLHGIARVLFLQPIVGDLPARQMALASGTAIVLAIALLTVRWIGAATQRQWLGIGLLWLLLTVGFDLALGRWVLGFSWERLAEDFAFWEGRLFALALLVLALAPLIAARLRRLPSAR